MSSIVNQSKCRVTAYIEIEKHSNIKYEYDHNLKKLVVDRILPYPYFYPFSYGFIPQTKADDDDELDVLLLTDQKCHINTHYDVYIVGALVMEDEKGMDEKILAILCDDISGSTIRDIDDISDEIKDNIHWFFSNYKSKTPNKWSKVHGFVNKEQAIELYQRSKI
jgi:inorganic pyrophosphatase